MIRHHAHQFGLKLRYVDRLLLGGVGIDAGHVLPDQQAQLVAPVIPAVRLDLDVLAGQLNPSLFISATSQRKASSVGAV